MYSCKVFPPQLVTHRKWKGKVKNKVGAAQKHAAARTQRLCVCDRLQLPVLCTWVLKEGREKRGEKLFIPTLRPPSPLVYSEYLLLWVKPFMASLIFDRKHSLFIRRTFFTISSLHSWCEPRVTAHYRLLLLSAAVPSPGEPRTFRVAPSPRPHPRGCELKLPLVCKKTKHLGPLFDRTPAPPQSRSPPPPVPAHLDSSQSLCIITIDLSPSRLHARTCSPSMDVGPILETDAIAWIKKIGKKCLCSPFDYITKVMDLLFKSGPKQDNMDRRTSVRHLGRRLH